MIEGLALLVAAVGVLLGLPALAGWSWRDQAKPKPVGLDHLSDLLKPTPAPKFKKAELELGEEVYAEAVLRDANARGAELKPITCPQCGAPAWTVTSNPNFVRCLDCGIRLGYAGSKGWGVYR